MKCDELKPLVFSLNDLAYIDESAVKKNFENPHDHAVYKATEVDAAIAELKHKLEDAKATAYAESIDANMENRRLRRALWMARAERAEEKQQLFHFSLGYKKLCIDGFYDPYSGRRELTPKQWIKVFNKVYVKCLKKAEEYK